MSHPSLSTEPSLSTHRPGNPVGQAHISELIATKAFYESCLAIHRRDLEEIEITLSHSQRQYELLDGVVWRADSTRQTLLRRQQASRDDWLIENATIRKLWALRKIQELNVFRREVEVQRRRIEHELLEVQDWLLVVEAVTKYAHELINKGNALAKEEEGGREKRKRENDTNLN